MGLIINGETFSDNVLNEYLNSERIRNAYTADCKRRGVEETEEGRKQFGEDSFIGDTVFLQGAKASIPPPKEHAIKSRLCQIKSRLYLPTDEVTPFEEEMRQIAVKDYYLVRFIKFLSSRVPHPTEEECKAYYEAHKDANATGEVYSFTHICFALDDYASQAEAVVDLLNLKTKIETSQNPDDSWWYAVEQYSITVEKDNGEYPLFTKGMLDPELETALLKCTDPKQISEPIITSEDTIDLFRFESKGDFGILPFAVVYPKIQRGLMKAKQDAALKKLLNELKAKAVIEHTPPEAVPPPPAEKPEGGEGSGQ